MSRARAPFLALSLFALTSALLSLTVCAGLVPARAPASSIPSEEASEGHSSSHEVELEVRSGETESPWHPVLYLDGRPLVVVPPGSSPAKLSCDISPGEHRFRILRERHDTRTDGSPIHAAEVSDAFLGLGGERGGSTTIHAAYRIRDRASDPPAASVELRRVRDGEEVDVVDSASWESLCEELKVGRRHPDARTLSSRHVLPRCVRWRELWPEETAVPSREEVREAVVGMEAGVPGEGCRSRPADP